MVCHHKIARILRDKLRSRYRDIRARIEAQQIRHGVQMPQPEFRRLFLRLALSYEKLRRQQHHEHVRNVRTEEIFKKAQQQYARCLQGIAVCPAMSVCKTEPPAPIAANILRSMNKPPGSNLKIYDVYSFYHEFVIFQH